MTNQYVFYPQRLKIVMTIKKKGNSSYALSAFKNISWTIKNVLMEVHTLQIALNLNLMKLI